MPYFFDERLQLGALLVRLVAESPWVSLAWWPQRMLRSIQALQDRSVKFGVQCVGMRAEILAIDVRAACAFKVSLRACTIELADERFEGVRVRW